jgi:thiol-disulfide isomerase/thioredoxin
MYCLKRLLFLIVAGLLCQACSLQKKETPRFESPAKIVLIFQRSEAPEDELIFEGGRRLKIDVAELSYTDESGWKPLRRDHKKNDTLTIDPEGEFVLFHHKYEAIHNFDFIFKKGDSVIFSYDGKKPSATIRNRKTLPYDINYQSAFQSKKNDPKKFSASQTFYDPYLVVNWTNKDLQGQIARIKTDSYSKAKADLAFENKFLDSLHLIKAISKEIFQCFKDKTKYNELILDMNAGKMSYQQIADTVRNGEAQSGLLPLLFYDNFIYAAAEVLFANNAREIDLGNTTIKDYRTVFDSIAASPLFQKKHKNALLFKQLQLIAEHFPLKDFKEYYSRFETVSSDTSMLEFMRKKYFLAFEEAREKTDSVYVMSLDRQRLTLNEVLEKNADKVVYIDFWASWCGPCRRVIPDSKKLKEKYSRKDVVIVYLSLDKEFDHWKKAVIEEGMEFSDNNYLVINSQTADYLRKLKIGSIPRYLLVDKNGKIAHNQAPGPGSQEIKKLIDQYISPAQLK